MAKRKKDLFDVLLSAFAPPKKKRTSNTPSRYKTVTGLNYGSRPKKKG